MSFNFFYKIMRIIDILSKKRNRKIIFIILIVIVVIFILHNKGYCSQSDSTYTTDTTYYILEQYDNICNDLVVSFDKNYSINSNATNYFNNMFSAIQSGRYPYLYVNPNNTNYTNIYLYNYTFDKTLVDTSLVYNDYTRIPSTAWNITYPIGTDFFTINRTIFNFNYSSGTSNVLNIPVPTILYMKIPSQIIDIMERAGYGYNGTQQDIIDIKELLESQNDKLDNINDTLDSFTNSNQDTSDITNVDTSASTSITSSEEYQDVESSYNGVWSNFISTINSMNESTPETIVIPLPYVNKQMLVSSNILSSRISSSIKSIITMFWWFVFGRHIILLWKRIFEYFASGSILNEESNSSGVLGFRNILKNYVDTINPFMM